MRWVERFEVHSQTDPTKQYVVSRADNGAWGCSCPVWKFRRQECKHIAFIKGQAEEVAPIGAVVETKKAAPVKPDGSFVITRRIRMD